MAMFSFTRFCLQVLADLNEIIRRLKQKCYSDNSYNIAENKFVFMGLLSRVTILTE